MKKFAVSKRPLFKDINIFPYFHYDFFSFQVLHSPEIVCGNKDFGPKNTSMKFLWTGTTVCTDWRKWEKKHTSFVSIQLLWICYIRCFFIRYLCSLIVNCCSLRFKHICLITHLYGLTLELTMCIVVSC